MAFALSIQMKQVRKMASNHQVLHTKRLRLRVTELEYRYNRPDSPMTKEAFIQEIQIIYREETGEKLEATIEVFSSAESEELKTDDSGYDGTAIRFHSEEQAIDEVYVASQGSQDMKDAEYNKDAMVIGESIDQAIAADDFTREALDVFGIEASEDMSEMIVSVHAIGHSLAHNNNATAHLVYDTFTTVHGANGAQLNYYQLYNGDIDFQTEVRKFYPELLNDPELIYNIEPKIIENLARDFYQDKEKNIFQDISTNDPLHWASGVPGFMAFGQIDYHTTNPELQNLRKYLDQLPHEDFFAIRNLSINVSDALNGNTLEEGLKELTGVDLKLIQSVPRTLRGVTQFYFSKDLENMVSEMSQKLPYLIQKVKRFLPYADGLLEELKKGGYITGLQKFELTEAIQLLEAELVFFPVFLDLWKNGRKMRASGNLLPIGQVSTNLVITALLGLAASSSVLYAVFRVLSKDKYKELLATIIDGHSLAELIDALEANEYPDSLARKEQIQASLKDIHALKMADWERLANRLQASGGGLNYHEEIYLNYTKAYLIVDYLFQLMQTGLRYQITIYRKGIAEAEDIWDQTLRSSHAVGSSLTHSEVIEALAAGGFTKQRIVGEPVAYYEESIQKAEDLEADFQALVLRIEESIHELVESDRYLANQIGAFG